MCAYVGDTCNRKCIIIVREQITDNVITFVQRYFVNLTTLLHVLNIAMAFTISKHNVNNSNIQCHTIICTG